jgi:hypothetical protein
MVNLIFPIRALGPPLGGSPPSNPLSDGYYIRTINQIKSNKRPIELK